MCSFLDLPNEIIVNHILPYLDHTSKRNFGYTCYALRYLVLRYSKNIIIHIHSKKNCGLKPLDLRKFLSDNIGSIKKFYNHNKNLIFIIEYAIIKNIVYLKHLLLLCKELYCYGAFNTYNKINYLTLYRGIINSGIPLKDSPLFSDSDRSKIHWYVDDNVITNNSYYINYICKKKEKKKQESSITVTNVVLMLTSIVSTSMLIWRILKK